MTRKKEIRPLKKHTLDLFAGDFDEVATVSGKPAGYVIRRIVRAFVESARRGQTPVEDIKTGLDLK